MSKKIHILYTIPNFDTAGSGKVVYDLANQLDKNRFKVSIACKHDKGELFKAIKALGLNVYLMDVTVPLRSYWTLIRRLKPLRSFLKNEQIDLVHSWNWSSDWSEVLACRMTNVPFVYTKKAMSWGNIHWKIRSYLSRFIITVNEDMKHFFPNKKHQQLIPFGLDTSYYNPEGFSDNSEYAEFKIITVANLVAVKAIEVLLEAVNELKHINVSVDIVGDTRAPYAEVLKTIVTDMQLDDKVSFLGKHQDVRALLAKSDLYVITSKNEGMPMALVEAMTMGVPVLGSNISGIRYVLQDFEELLFPVSDYKVLARKIEFMYNKTPQERKTLGEILRKYCIEHFSMQTFIDAHERLYLKLVK